MEIQCALLMGMYVLTATLGNFFLMFTCPVTQ